jgi:saccharopine dehydrogenase (NAD+, L-lysine-forming)
MLNNEITLKPLLNTGVIGILRETKSPWERRVALTPTGCKKLISEGIRILVQPSRTRCFSDDEYQESGCEIVEDLKPCNLILGLHYQDTNRLLENKTYLIFSHCKKGKQKIKDS